MASLMKNWSKLGAQEWLKNDGKRKSAVFPDSSFSKFNSSV